MKKFLRSLVSVASSLLLILSTVLVPIHTASAAMTIEGGTTVRASGVNANADVVLPAVAGTIYQIKYIMVSYSGVPTGGRVGVLSGAVVVFDLDITQAGPILLPFTMTEDVPGTAITVRLFAGGAGITGKVTVAYVAAVVS
jgi:hypothetical protein